MGLLDPVMLSRIQFSFTIGFHIIFPVLTIGLSVFLVVVEALWLRTGEEAYYRHARFWGRLFLLGFSLGVASGVVMEFQFGTNWSRFASAGGGFVGTTLGFEAAMAFAAEAAFLALMAFGWQRLPRGIHMFSTSMVAAGATVSAFWIMDANAWMQTPRGVAVQDGVLTVTSYARAMFNPDLPVSFSHMWAACVVTGMFVVAGLSAWQILRGRGEEFFLRSFKIALVFAIFLTPLQIYLGDASGQLVAQHQPAKLAAMESFWTTSPAGQGAPWSVVAIPDTANERNRWALQVPYLLSLLVTHSPTGKVVGLKEFPPEDRPPILLPFYGFRLMVAAGFLMFFLMLWTAWGWARGWLRPGQAARRRALMWCWVLAIPLGFVAVETGWIVREVGRQPWMVYGLLRTEEASSVGLSTAQVLGSLVAYVALYAALFILFLLFAWRIVRKGPEMGTPIPEQQQPHRAATSRDETHDADHPEG